MRRSSTKTAVGKGFAGTTSRADATVLGTPAITSCGLFHQQVSRSSIKSSNGTTATGESSRYAATAAADKTLKSNGNQNNNNRSNDNALLLVERHTSAAKDGLIDMLTEKASTLGASLERVMVGKKEVEDRLDRLQRAFEEETAKRKDLEQRLLQREEHVASSSKDKEHLEYEVDALQRSLRDSEERSKGWIQEESNRRRSAEEALSREHAVVVEYLKGIYREGDGPSLGEDESPTAEVLVRELHLLGEELRKRDAELRVFAEQLDDTGGDLKAERERNEAMQDQLVSTQERLETTKRKARQVSGQLEVEIRDNKALRERVHALVEEIDMRTKAIQERKEKAQQRKRGDTRDMMAESKAKDDRIKNLESTLMQERARLEEELRSARSDYEEAAKESRRKAGRLQRRCMELEYRVATQNNKASEQSGGSGATNTSVSTSSPSSVAGQAPGLNSETSRSALKAVPGLLSAASVIPWRRGGISSETSSTTGSATAGSAVGSIGSAAPPAPAAGKGAAARAGRRAAAAASASAGRRGGEGGEGGGGRGGGEGVEGGAGGGRGRGRGGPSGGEAPTHPGGRSADRLPDPSRHNESAPAWMRADLALDRVQED